MLLLSWNTLNGLARERSIALLCGPVAARPGLVTLPWSSREILKDVSCLYPGLEAGKASLADLFAALVGDDLSTRLHHHQFGGDGDPVPGPQLTAGRRGQDQLGPSCASILPGLRTSKWVALPFYLAANPVISYSSPGLSQRSVCFKGKGPQLHSSMIINQSDCASWETRGFHFIKT